MKITELKSVIDLSRSLFQELKQKHKDLKGYLVFSSRLGQCLLTDNLEVILKEFPEMINDSEEKSKAVEIGSMVKGISRENLSDKKREEKKRELANSLNDLGKKLDIKGDTFVEIRFENTPFETIYKLQTDQLVSQTHTPHARASIRIVLGTISEIASKHKTAT